MSKKVYRTFTGQLEMQTNDEDDRLVLTACFVRYDVPAPARPYDYYEQIARGCFGTSLFDDIMCLYNHNPDLILGRVSAGTLSLEDRPDGLYGTIVINADDAEAVNVYNRVKRGDICGCSFGAWIESDRWETSDGHDLCTIEQAELFEVSVCPFPFYPTTTVESRSAQHAEAEDHKRRRACRERLFLYKKKKVEKKLHDCY